MHTHTHTLHLIQTLISYAVNSPCPSGVCRTGECVLPALTRPLEFGGQSNSEDMEVELNQSHSYRPIQPDNTCHHL